MRQKDIATSYSTPNLTLSNGIRAWFLAARRSSLAQLALIDLLLFLGMSFAVPDLFLSSGNFASMAEQFPGYGLLALAMAIPMISGGIDLSIIALSNLSAITAALIMRHFAGGMPVTDYSVAVVLASILVAIALGAIGGLINGAIIAFIGIPPILVTLGSGLVFSGIAIVATNGTAVFGLPDAFSWVASGQLSYIPVPAVLFAVLAGFLSLLLTRTAFGAKLYLFGTNPHAARYAGIDVRTLLLKTYITSGLCAAVAGLVLAAGANSAKADYGQSYLLLAIVICVLGGVSPTGGSGRISGIVLAVFALQFLSSGLNLLGVNNFAVEIAWGGILLFTMWINRSTIGTQR